MSSAYSIDDDIALWERFVTPALGQRATQQFVRASKQQSNLFNERFVRPQLFRPELPGGGAYVPVDLSTQTPGRNHFLAERLADPAAFATLGADPMIGLTYFTNPLRIGCERPGLLTGEMEWERPSDRVVLGDLHAFTFEFDLDDRAFLERQLSWLRSPKNPLDSRIGGLYRHLAQFADFAGITVNYSGNKSLHFHLVFETGLAATAFGLGADSQVRRGLMSHWDNLHAMVLDHLDLPAGIKADTSLRAPEAYRRLPNGSRKIEKPGHILALPVGECVRQVTLWEKWTGRAANGVDCLFFKPEPFLAPTPVAGNSGRVAAMASRRSLPSFKQVLGADELAFCEDKLRVYYPGYPKFARLAVESGKWVARFLNSPADRTPSSIMTGEHDAIHLVGRDAEGLMARKLPYPLAIMLRGWVAEHRRMKAPVPEWEDCDWTVDSARTASPDPQEVAFAEAATDQAEASRQVRRFLRRAVMSNDCSLICAPEGIRKTSSLFADHRRLDGALATQTGSKPSMYAFSDYKAATDKCLDFNEAQGAMGAYHGVVLPSFSKAYADACRTLGVGEITTETAAQNGYRNLWEAVAKIQPAVLDDLKQRHRRMWNEIGGRKPVFFTVHDVAQRWTLNTPTRLMWARDFWIGRMDDPGHVRDCRRSTVLGLLVHDEVSFESIISMHRAEVVQWVTKMKAADPKVWRSRHGHLASQWASYRRFAAANPFPVIDGASFSISFNEARGIAVDSDWEEVEAGWSGEYGGLATDETQDIYQKRKGSRWCVAAKDWRKGAAQRVIVLTTEAVPTAVARRVAGWTVQELETPLLSRDSVDVFPLKGVSGANLLNVVKDYRRAPEAASRIMISNKVKALPGTITHMAARGSNAFIGQDLAQTMTFFTPDEVERLEVLNAWTGRSDLIRLRHWDQFNQTAGRNLGFRKSGDVRHDLLISHRLLECLLGDGLGRSRYDLRLHMSRGRRYAVRLKAA